MTNSVPAGRDGPDEYELSLINAFFETFAPNRNPNSLTQAAEMTWPRHPEAEIFPGSSGLEDDDTELKLQVYISWQRILWVVDEALLYDGTNTGFIRFLDTTGLSPIRFAQGWLESKDNFWRFCHPARDVKEVLRHLLEIWAMKIKRWYSMGKDAARAYMRACCPDHDWEADKAFVDKELGKIFVKEKDTMQHHGRDLLLAVKATVIFNCPDHPMRNPCSCPITSQTPVLQEIDTKANFAKMWQAKLLSEDDAFLFDGTDASARFFQIRHGGQTVQCFASRWFAEVSRDMNNAFVPTTTETDLINALVKFWAAKMAFWRWKNKTRQEVRTFMHSAMRVDVPGLFMIDNRTLFYRGPLKPNERMDCEDDLVRVIQFGPEGHKYTAALYPHRLDCGELRYSLLPFGIVPCHEECWRCVPD